MNDEYRYCECSNGHRDVLYHPRLGVDICTQCGGIVRPNDEDNGKKIYDEPRISKEECQPNEYSKKAWAYYMDFKEEEALHYIDLALDLDKSHSDNWNRKAIILEGMKRYKESERCYDISLNLSFSNVVCDNKVRMLYDWASQLIEEAKKLQNGLKKLEEAKKINMRAITSRSGENSEEDLDKYLGQRDTINSYIDQEKEYQRNLETLKTYPKEELFTIAGRHFYNNKILLTPNMHLKLVKEPDNEYDKNAIAVYAEDEKIGYVANGDKTCELTTDANGLEYLPEITYARYIMNYCDSYHVAKIIKDRYINLMLANRYKRKGEYSKALDCYNEVLELDPDDEYCLNRKPELLCLLKRWDEALKFYDMMGNWSGKASVFIEMGNYEDAFNCYDAIDDWYGKAIVLIHMGRYEEVLECCDKLVGFPFYVRNLRDIGMLLIHFERYWEAVECLGRALSKSPNEPSVLSLMDYALSCLEEEI